MLGMGVTHWGEAKNVSSTQLSAIAIDRKSTRLNSSHANISYAVFCLKKKKRVEHLKCLDIKGKTEANTSYFKSKVRH